MSDEWMILIELITSWILTAFLSFVPKWGLGKMGTGQIRDKTQAFPADFFPNFRIFFFFSSLPTACCILPTASFQSLSKTGLSLSKSGHSLSKTGQSLSKQDQSLSPKGYSLSPRGAFALSRPSFVPIAQGFVPNLPQKNGHSRDRSSVAVLNGSYSASLEFICNLG